MRLTLKMDEILFRGSQRLETLQIQLGMVKNQGKELLDQYSEQSKAAITQIWVSPRMLEIRESFSELWMYVISIAKETKHYVVTTFEPNKIILGLHKVFGNEWTYRNICFGCAGLLIGGLLGFWIGVSMRRPAIPASYMQAVQCSQYGGIEGAMAIEDAPVPTTCRPNEVIVQVQAASVHIIDAKICHGYGHRIRWLLSPYFQNKHDLPVTLGRDCTGIVTDIGQNVRRLEIGDEVWLTTPFWAPGTMAQIIVVPEYRVTRKPKTSGFEASSSLPYAGCVAFSTLKEAGINADNGLGKRVLVQDGCTPVGCVLIQVLKLWSVDVTTTCMKRAVPVARALGADDIITLLPYNMQEQDSENESDFELKLSPFDLLKKELDLRDRFDVIINTRRNAMNINGLKKYCNDKRLILSAYEKNLMSDDFGHISAFAFWFYVKLKRLFQRLSGSNLGNFGEPHMCHISLEELCNLVEDGLIQTVVERVYHPQEIDRALAHIQSVESIGSCVITFRNREVDYGHLNNPNSYWVTCTSVGAPDKVITAKNSIRSITFKKRRYLKRS